MTNQPLCVVFPKAYAVGLQPQEALTGPGDDEFVLDARYSLISPATERGLYTETHISLSDPR